MAGTRLEKQEHAWTAWPPHDVPFGSRPMRVEEIDEDGCVVIRAELPDVDVEHDLDVQVRNHLLEIRATRTQPKTAIDSGARHSEFEYGRLWRVLTLPHGAQEADIEATYRHGILEVRVPLTRAEPTEGRRIPVRRA
jgi:HSP20 family molecular chaperone IbpA